MINKIVRAGLVGCGLAAALVACTDTWDDHYDGSAATGMAADGSLWEAIKQNPELSNFASIIEATGYDRSLGSNQVFTVFAPTNNSLSEAEAKALIEQYKQDKLTMTDDDNTVIKEFVQNHIALYNHSVSPSSNDSIVLMNNKYAILKANGIDNSSFLSSNKLYGNGLLYTVDRPIDYSANVFEYLRKDADLDSVRAFLYNPLFYYKKFNASQSVEGGIDELGRTIYLDSVFNQRNDLFAELGQLNSEDSVYWMLAPTNDQWAKLVERYTPYFNYAQNVEDLLTKGTRDSLVYTNIRKAILEGATFSETVNKAIARRAIQQPAYEDSVYSTAAPIDFDMREYMWGNKFFNYYQYFSPFMPGGVLSEPDTVACSNGRMLKVRDWKIDELQTFNRWIVVEAEGSGSIREIAKYQTNAETKDSAQLADAHNLRVLNNHYDQHVWGNRYVRFQPTTTQLYNVTFNIQNVLSNMPYDIYLVTAPSVANDSNSVDTLGTTIRCTIYHNDADGKEVNHRFVNKDTERATAAGIITVNGKGMDYILLAENYEFPICTYGVRETMPQVRLLIENRVSNSQANAGTYTKNLNVDCILLVPHGTLRLDLDPELVWMYPHGWYSDDDNDYRRKASYKYR